MFLFLGFSLNAQTKNNEFKFKEHQIDKLIKEVYQDKAEAIIFSDAIRYKGFKNLLLNRVSIYKQQFKDGEEYQNLSEVALLKTYNSNLFKDFSFNQSNFNPLKYDISLFSNEVVIYRIDKQHILFIKSQKN